MQCVLETPEGLVEDVRGGEEDGGNSTVQCKNKIRFEPTVCLLPSIRGQQ